MSLLSNINNVAFASAYPIDKIAYEGTATESVANGVTTTKTYSNPYGKKAFVTLSWSVDNSNFYPAQAYTSPAAPYTANGWCDASNVYVYLENFSGSTVTFYIKYVLDSIT